MLVLNLKHMLSISAHCPRKLMASPAYASQTRSVQMILVRLIAKLSQLIKQLYDVSPNAHTYNDKKERNYDVEAKKEKMKAFRIWKCNKCIMYILFRWNKQAESEEKIYIFKQTIPFSFLFIHIEFFSLPLSVLLSLLSLSVLMCMRLHEGILSRY